MIIEEVVRDYLDDNLSVPVYLQRQDGISGSYVMVEKTGGSKINQINSAIIALQSYGASIHTASDLNEQVKAVMDGIVQLSGISGCRLDTDYNFTDEERGEYRYQAVFALTHY